QVVLEQAGCVIAGATSNIAPADKRLYAIRDVTATVESRDLITASILSKKLAAGLEGLVLDVKVGSGAFMKSLEEARELASALVDTANAAGCPTTALITDMNQPLSQSLGNALEVADVVHVMREGTPHPLTEICAALGGPLLAGANLAETNEAGAKMVSDAIASGQALERFGQMITAMGGPLAFIDNPSRYLPEATVIREITSQNAGYVTGMDGETLGLAVVELGGGRKVETDVIDPSVGLSNVARLGAKVAKGGVLAVVHASRPELADQAEQMVRAAITIGPKAVDVPPLIHDIVH
ncbi:MAG: thymidine phosphorylase, partial [Rhodobacteraceae bacterium]|nr:thymidine phosphorylase [Paracoccaceae bacterium]